MDKTKLIAIIGAVIAVLTSIMAFLQSGEAKQAAANTQAVVEQKVGPVAPVGATTDVAPTVVVE